MKEIRCKSKGYSNSFYPDSIRCWNKIGPELRNSLNLEAFNAIILALIRPPPRAFVIFMIRLESSVSFNYVLGLAPLMSIKWNIILAILFLLNVSFPNAQKTSITFSSTTHVIQVPDVLYLISYGH